ncbi:YppE family protein [Niallia sp.]|uniref:YppE family protein n=1 Tax=Niallia sp. TaxID=2837523 RepID=UPI00289F3C35|nr:YppE family protein [Niallia sp.]
MTENHQLMEHTEKLLEAVDYSVKMFYKVKETGVNEDFYEIVRPFANRIKQLNDEWKELAKAWVRQFKPDYLNSIQIDTASDHIEIISIQAFFAQTSKKRFLDSAKSVKYILQTLLDALKVENQ